MGLAIHIITIDKSNVNEVKVTCLKSVKPVTSCCCLLLLLWLSSAQNKPHSTIVQLSPNKGPLYIAQLSPDHYYYYYYYYTHEEKM